MNRIEIKKWLLDKGIKQVDIAKKLGLKPSTVSLVIKGFGTSRRIYDCLRELGCPTGFLKKAA